MNAVFETCKKELERAPVYDAAFISGKGTEYMRFDTSNNANNGHSTTKLFVATAIGMLEDDGKLSRYDGVTSFFTKDELPAGMDEKWNAVTVEHCLQHKTGMDTIPFGVDDDDSQPKIGDDYLGYVLSLPVEHEPGSYRRYSDAAYYLLCRVIEKAAGIGTEEFFRNRIMNPLGFRQWATAKCPQGHVIGGGGLYTRADDLAKLGWLYANMGVLDGKRLLSEKWIRDAMANDYALTSHRNTSIYVKTGACGQMVWFSAEKKAAGAWHGCIKGDNGDRNNVLLDGVMKELGVTAE